MSLTCSLRYEGSILTVPKQVVLLLQTTVVLYAGLVCVAAQLPCKNEKTSLRFDIVSDILSIYILNRADQKAKAESSCRDLYRYHR